MSCCKSIGEALKKVLKAIAPILAIALLAFAAYAYFVVGAAQLGSVAALSWMPAGMAAISGTTAAYIALGASILLDPSTVGSVLGDVAEGVGTVIGDVIGGVAGGLFGGNFLLIALGGFALWWLLTKDDKEEATPTKSSTPAAAETNAASSEPKKKANDDADAGANLKEFEYGK